MMRGTLAEKLRILRAQRGLSLMEAAERTGVTRDTLSELERGKRHAYMPTLTKVARGYGVPVEELLGEPVLSGKAEAPSLPRMSEEERRPNAWLDDLSEGERFSLAASLLKNIEEERRPNAWLEAIPEGERFSLVASLLKNIEHFTQWLELDALPPAELENLYSSLGAGRDAVARAMVRKARGWTEEPLSAESAEQRERRETWEAPPDPRESDPLSLEWAYRVDLDLFRAALKDRESAELRGLGENLGSEFSRVPTRDELEAGSPPDVRRVRAFVLAGIVNEELLRRGEKPLRDLPAFRRFEDAMADPDTPHADDEVGGAEAG